MTKRAYREIERVIKGAANHRRMEIMDLLSERPELSVLEIADLLSVEYRTLAEHLRKLTIAGLIRKRHEGATVRHSLTATGKIVLKFCRTLV